MNNDWVAAWELHLPSGNLKADPIKAIQLGFNPKDFTHYTHYTDLIHPEDYVHTMQVMRNHLAGKTDRYQVQYRIKAADGNYHTYFDRGQVVKRDDDKIVLRGGTVDIT